MARRVYFAFHYQEDIWRVNHVRNHNTTKQDRDEYGFFDGSLWEEEKNNNHNRIKQMIDDKINGTTVTSVLIGSQTYSRPWVRYEIVKSYVDGNGLLGVQIHQQKNQQQQAGAKGPNPFDYLSMAVNHDGKQISFSEWDGAQWVSFTKLPSIATNCDRQHFGQTYQFSKFYSLYDWQDHDGYNNFGTWVESAATKAGR